MTVSGVAAKPLVLPRVAAVLLLLALAAYLAVRGVAPALSKLDADFPSYLTAARIVADGGEVDRLYDNAWFQQQMLRYHIGDPSLGKFAPFPPPTALLLLPLSRLQPLDALRAMAGITIVSMLVSIVVLSRILSWSPLESAVLVLLSGAALVSALRFGQPYAVVSLSCILGYGAYLRGRPLLSGVCFGLFTPIKYFPVVDLIYFSWQRQWRVALGGAAAILAVALLSIGVLGWRIHREFLSSVLGTHLIGKLSMQDPFAASFQSFDSLFRRLFVFDAVSNPRPMMSWPQLDVLAVVVTKVTILCIAVATLVRLRRIATERAVPVSIGILGILVFLLAPATATYHFLLLWLPIGLLVNFFLREGAPAFGYFILGVYALIGFFPYGFSSRFEGQAALTVLAYPRLFLMLAMFIACVIFVWRPPRGAT